MNNTEIFNFQIKNSQFTYFSFLFVGGTSIEGDYLGLSHFLEHLILNSGGANSLNTYFDKIGSEIRGETSRDYIHIGGYCRRDDFENALNYCIQKIFSPIFTFDDFKKEKDIILLELNEYKKLFLRKEEKSIFQNSDWQYDIIGHRKGIQEFSLKNVIDFHNTIIRTGKCSLIVNGRNLTHLLPISSFENICNKTAINLPLFNAVTIDNNDNEICNIGINYHISKNNLSARELGMLALFNGMLTGIKNSILFQKLRKEQRLIYHISSYPTLTQNICLFKIYTKTTKFNKSIVVDIIKKEINAIYRNGISNETIFKQSKRRVVNEMILKLENDKADMIKQLAKSDLFRTPTYMEIINELGNVSLNELNRFLKSDILFKNQCSIFID